MSVIYPHYEIELIDNRFTNCFSIGKQEMSKGSNQNSYFIFTLYFTVKVMRKIISISLVGNGTAFSPE